jgi:hypothetical protein
MAHTSRWVVVVSVWWWWRWRLLVGQRKGGMEDWEGGETALRGRCWHQGLVAPRCVAPAAAACPAAPPVRSPRARLCLLSELVHCIWEA